jgi:hypothetical protein
MLNKKVYERLAPFIHRKSARQRLILYLIADGYTVGDLVRMTVAELNKISLPVEMDVSRDEILDGRNTGYAFVFPGGKGMLHTTYYRLLRSTSEKVLKRPMSQEKFRDYIHSSQ